MRRLQRLGLAAALAVVSLGAAGCNEYHYWDIDVSFGGFSVNDNEISTIQVVVMTVSGADNGEIQIGPNANGLPVPVGTHLGVFEFSTFADSGELTFTGRAYDDATSNPDCLTGTGSKTAQATSTVTNNETLVIMRSANGCAPP